MTDEQIANLRAKESDMASAKAEEAKARAAWAQALIDGAHDAKLAELAGVAIGKVRATQIALVDLELAKRAAAGVQS